MLKDLNYICFDFETTWLNFEKDEPIQIGILKFNNKFEITKTYKTYIKPRKDIDELRNIVSFITWLKLENLETAKYFEEIIPEFSDFFDENSVLIWHNIDFDINFMEKYHKINSITKIDTFTLSRTLLHYLPSYALEIINEIIKDKVSYNLNVQIDETYHDALYDSLSAYKTFRYCIEYLKELIQKYPSIWYLILKSESFYKDILDISKFSKSEKTQYFLPSLKKEIKNENRIYNPSAYELDWFTDFTKLYIWNVPLKKVLANLVTGKNKVLLAFSNQAKVDIAKNIIQDFWIKQIWQLYEDIIFDTDNITKLINKESFEEYELNFIIKYFSHHNQWYSILDINSTEDYKIFNFIKQTKEKTSPNVVLTTHQKLFDYLKNTDKLTQYNVYLFDWDYWYNSVAKFVNKPFDLYDTIFLVENLLYKYKYEQKDEYISKFYNWLMIFSGIFFTEVTKKFKDIQDTKIEIDPIIENIDFYKTNLILKNLKSYFKYLKKELSENDYEKLKKNFDEFTTTISWICLAERKMYNEDKFYYVFYKNNNVINYQEFLDIFWGHRTIFFTNFDKEKSIKINKESELPETTLNIEKNFNKFWLAEDIKNYECSFILSTSKPKSKELFDLFFQNWLHEKYKILIENITWWYGKNIFYSQRTGKKIIIGWYDFLFSAISKWVKIEKIFIYHMTWPLEKQMINDIYYWIN